MSNAVVVVGCGGVASYLVPVLIRTLSGDRGDRLVLVDGDTLEPQNLDRQLFSPADVGRNKAEALASLCGNASVPVQAVPEWFHSGLPLPPPTIFMVAADNHPARKEVLEACDRTGASAIFGANEVREAEAYIYHPQEDAGSPRDPRVRYPEILTDRADDPRSRDTGCVSRVTSTGGQSAAANFLAAAFMMHLFVAHYVVAPELAPETHGLLPFAHRSNFSAISTRKINS